MASKPKDWVALRYPAGGVDKNFPLQYQPPYTTPAASNFISQDVLTERERGGSRPGLAAYGSIDGANAHAVLAAQEVRWLNSGTPTSTLVMSKNGHIYSDNGSGTFSDAASSAYASAAFQMTNYLQDLYYPSSSASGGQGVRVLHFGGGGSDGAGGSGYLTGDNALLDPTGDGTQTYNDLSHTAPTAPDNARLVTHWSDRVVVASKDIGQVFMSAQGNPRDWRYGESLSDVPGDGGGAAVALADSPNAGTIPDIVTALITHTDQCLIIASRASMHILRGNPTQGGTLSPLIEGVGCIGANSWCYDDQGYLWWLSQDGMYVMSPGCDNQMLRAVSRSKLPKELVGLSEDAYYVSLAYDRRFRGIHVVVYPISGGTQQCYFVSTKTSLGELVGQASFWPMDYSAFHPTICFQRPYYRPASTALSPVLFGGIVSTTTVVKNWDTGTACEVASSIDIGPFPLAPDGYSGILHEIQLATAASSDALTLGVRTGNTPEAAYNASEFTSYSLGTTPGLQYTVRPRVAGAFAVLQLRGATSKKIAAESIIIRRETTAPRRKG